MGDADPVTLFDRMVADGFDPEQAKRFAEAEKVRNHEQFKRGWKIGQDMRRNGGMSSTFVPPLPTMLDRLLVAARAQGIEVEDDWTIAHLRGEIATCRA